MPKVRKKKCVLYHPPLACMFQRAQQDDLYDTLQRIDKETSIFPLTDHTELQLDAEGKTIHGGYTYTASSFQQVCRILAAGASTVLRNISGIGVNAPSDDELYDQVLARDMFNRIVELRFPLLRSYRVIRNEEDKLLDGVVGGKHYTLDNSTLYGQVCDTLRASAGDVEFYAAALLGRKLLLWYRMKEPLFAKRTRDGKLWRFRKGYFFCNSEIRGTSVRGTLAIYTPQGMCLGPYKQYGGRVAHIGRDFHRRLDKVFSNILSQEVPEQQLSEGCAKLMKTSLGWKGTDMDFRKTVDKPLVRALGSLHVPQRIGHAVVDDAWHAGAENDAAILPYSGTVRKFSTRSQFDLFAALVRAARALNVTRREVLEQAAFRMLSGALHRR